MPRMAIDKLLPGERLGIYDMNTHQGDPPLVSPGGTSIAVLQQDGNFVVYRGDGQSLWSSGTNDKPVRWVAMQGDGNVVLLDAQDRPIWASATQGNANAFLRLQDDCNLVLYAGARTQAAWASDTYGCTGTRSGNTPTMWEDIASIPGEALSAFGGAIDWATHPAQALVSNVVDTLRKIPGLGDAIKTVQAFARTPTGSAIFEALAGAAVGPAGGALLDAYGPVYGAAAASLATIGLVSAPGVLQGDTIGKGFSVGVTHRLEKILEESGEAEMLKVAGELAPTVEKLLSGTAMGQVYKALADQYQKGLIPLSKLAQTLGVREDTAQSALDLLSHEDTIGELPFTLPGGAPGSGSPGKAGRIFDTKTGKELPTRNLHLAALAPLARKHVPFPAKGLVALALGGDPTSAAYVSGLQSMALSGNVAAQRVLVKLDRGHALMVRDYYTRKYLGGASGYRTGYVPSRGEPRPIRVYTGWVRQERLQAQKKNLRGRATVGGCGCHGKCGGC